MPEGTRKLRPVKGGQFVVMIKVSNRAKKGSRWMLEHRYKMEKKLGRKLKSSEHVHHKNEDRTDNRMSNLKLMTKSKHSSVHAKEQHRNKNFGQHVWTEESKRRNEEGRL